MTEDDKYFGRMNDPTSSAMITGPCGDSMEFYLVIKDEIIEDVKYYTEGCGNTRACG
ncbi:MAG: iron-sulfur cluster assembly scaffold protein, partial [Kiritimatiellae bacterium]|nr:iron-sulfur cluster assembly scaffold protein [Kiritimatiellia bacterium]